MFTNTLNLEAEGSFREMVYFPLNIDSLITALLSAIATTIVILLSLIFKLYKKPTSLMVFAINIAHALFYYTKLSVLVQPPTSDSYCKFLNVFNIYGLESTSIWSALFAHAFYFIVKYPSSCDTRLPRVIKKYYLPIAVLFPLINGALSLFTNHLIYSETAGTCVHRVYPDQFDVTGHLFFRFPILLTCLASIVWYKMAINKIFALQDTRRGTELYVFMIYPGILLLCWGPHVVIQTAVQLGLPVSRTLVNISIYLSYLQGFFDALVYGKSVGKVLSNAVKNYLGKDVSNERETLLESTTSDEYSNRIQRDVSFNSSYLSDECEIDVIRNQSTRLKL